MGLQELRAGSPRRFETQDGLTRAAGWQPAGVLEHKRGLRELRAGSNGLESQDGLTRAKGWQPAGVLRPKMGLQELDWQPARGFETQDGLTRAARRRFDTQDGLTRAAGWQHWS